MNTPGRLRNQRAACHVHRTMMRRVWLAALVLAFAAVGVLAPSTAKPVGACNPVGNPTLEGDLRVADAVIVGEAIDESTVHVAATLKGSTDPETVISRFNISNCPDPPGLYAGEHVLLLLGRYEGGFQIFGFGRGRYVLTDGMIKPEYGTPMPAEDFVRRVAAITAAPQQQLDAALASIRGEPTAVPPREAEPLPNDADNGGGLPWLVVGLGGAVLAGLVVLLVWARRPTSSTDG